MQTDYSYFDSVLSSVEISTAQQFETDYSYFDSFLSSVEISSDHLYPVCNLNEKLARAGGRDRPDSGSKTDQSINRHSPSHQNHKKNEEEDWVDH